jgi:hypothetical protein
MATLASSSQVTPSTAEIKSSDLNLILQGLEDIQHQDPSQSRPYELTREYKVFHGNNWALADGIDHGAVTAELGEKRGNYTGLPGRVYR